MALATPTLTNINDKSLIYFSQSPIHFDLVNELGDSSISLVTVEVYVWRGFQQADLPAAPSITFNNIKKISPGDKYIAIELHNEIKAFITASNLNKNNPQWSYNTTGLPATAGQGVYFHIVYKVDTESVKQLGTFFATGGYRYSFEQKFGPYATYNDVETLRKYAFGIKYDRNTINRTTQVATSQSGSGTNGMITQQLLNPTNRKLQTGVKCLIAYLNRVGVWDTFTPFGKFSESIDTKRDEFSSSFRNPLYVNSQIQHLKQSGAPMGKRKFQINTGLLDENNNYQVREILQSGKIYLVVFGEEVYLNEQTGITVDSTVVTVDNTTITVDSDVVTAADLGFYSNYEQIPVTNSMTNFLKKTSLNDKSSISYSLEFEETNNFINNIL
jgi:hypothetical protein